jgi:hypothetical protein
MRLQLRINLLAFVAIAMLALSGCGYALAGRGAFLPDYIRSIGVPQFTNNTPVFDVDRRVSDRVRAELSNRGKYKVYPTETGMDAVLTGEINAITFTPASLNQQQQVTRMLLIMTAKVEFKDLKTGKVLWANPALQFRDEFEPTTGSSALDPTAFFGQDANALERVSTEFARSVVSALLEAF